MMYHLFHNYMWKVVRIAKTSDCKISWRVFLQGTVSMLFHHSNPSRLSRGTKRLDVSPSKSWGSGIFEIRFATKVLVFEFAKAEKQLSEAGGHSITT